MVKIFHRGCASGGLRIGLGNGLEDTEHYTCLVNIHTWLWWNEVAIYLVSITPSHILLVRFIKLSMHLRNLSLLL